MPEYLVNFRSNTGKLISVRVCNVEDEDNAIKLATNSILTDEEVTYESLYQYESETDI